jgi:tRNA threonylcarbamoyladenosine biosynthesis protein TsaE
MVSSQDTVEHLDIPDRQFCERLSLSSLQQTQEIGRRLAAQLSTGVTVLLCGNLGAGKTSLAQGIVAGCGSNEKVTSPTFSICNIYQGSAEIHHYDLYRLNSPAELYSAGFEESVDSDTIVLVEWPDLSLEFLQGHAIVIKLYHSLDTREIEFGKWPVEELEARLLQV